MNRRNFLSLLGTAALLPLAGCTGRRVTYRYRLTVDVDTPEGVRTGSSVIEVTTRWDDGLAHATGVRSQVRGEAVVVDGLPGGPLFALLTGGKYGADAAKNYAREALGFTGGQSNADTYYAAMREMMATPGEHRLPPDAWPLLVRFRDIDDPTSVERVDSDDLAASFGEGVSLRAITVEITKDAVTDGIDERLPWLSEYPEPRLDPDYRGSTQPSLAQRLWHGDFVRRQ